MVKLSAPRNWREKKHRYRFIGSICEKCSYKMFPTRKVCPKCRSKDLKDIELAREGKIITFTIVRSAPEGLNDFAPYPLAIVELDGVKIMLQIVDTEFKNVDIGKKVEIVFRKLYTEGKAGHIIYGPKARMIV